MTNSTHSMVRANLNKSECLVTNTKGGFFSESAMRFLDLQISKKKYSEKLS